ncbi:MAG: hypothetical protein ACI8P9_003201 [Parasphingorhabdus sp.]|jgi:hypothetical protein
MKDNDTEPPASWIDFLSERGPFINQQDMDYFISGLRLAGISK